ncbi:MAG: HAMP domain-containing protein [Desulfobacteraceae bacterium]|nr:HAMP domain-containing protein [Desulfobacteraceae bacterium]
MKVKCEKCQTAFDIGDKLIKETGAKLRCSKCRHVFTVYPAPHPEPQTTPVPHHPEPETEQPETKTPEVSVVPSEKKYIPFKTKLIYFAAVIICFIAVIVIPVEVYRPWKKLSQLIENAKNLINGVEASVNPSDLARMNKFAIKTVIDTYNKTLSSGQADDLYNGLVFNMLLTENEVLSEKLILDKIESSKQFKAFKGNFDYNRVLESRKYWTSRFSDDPGILNILRKYKVILIKASKNARQAGFKVGHFTILADSGKPKGFFKKNVALLLDNSEWRSIPYYTGQPFTPDDECRRNLALTGQTGYGNKELIDFGNWLMPGFSENEQGVSWFGVWLTRKTGAVFNVFNLDFDAVTVKRLMLAVFLSIACVSIVLFIMVAFIAGFLSKLVTMPVTELTKGAGQVASGNYEYMVPVLKEDEFGRLTRQFNKMTQGQKERLNLMETLEKFLSKELAEMAAEKGIMLGGQDSDCTVMFTDFAGFSTITQKMTASEAVEVLNLYFEAMISIVKSYGGFPDKYIGDAIVAMFGAPVTLEDHAERAVACAITMQQKMREINDKRRKQVCFRITDDALVYLESEGVSDEFVEKLEAIREQTLLEYLKSHEVSSDIVKKLETIKQQEYIGKGEFLAGEFLDIVLKNLCDEQDMENCKSLVLNYAEKQERALFEMRIGLNSGEVIAGAIGCDSKLEYTSIGETTNLANRMEASCKVGHVAIAEKTYFKIKNVFFKGVNISATPEVVEVKGMGKVPVYRIYVNNLSISKDMKSKSINTFYVYEETDHQLKYKPDEIEGVKFTSIARFVEMS